MGNMPKRFRNIIGARVKALRTKRELTQEQLLARLQIAGLDHYTRETVAKIEGNIRSVFDYEVPIIAQCLDVEIAELMPRKAVLTKALPDLIQGHR